MREAEGAEPPAAATPPAPKQPEKKQEGRSWFSTASHLASLVIFIWACTAAWQWQRLLYPHYPDVDQQGKPVFKVGNLVAVGDELELKIWVVNDGPHRSRPRRVDPSERRDPDFQDTVVYDWGDFKPVVKEVNITASPEDLLRGVQTWLFVKVVHRKSGQFKEARGSFIKSVKREEHIATYELLGGAECPQEAEPPLDKARSRLARGIPKMQVRLVFDETRYPAHPSQKPYMPPLLVDDMWMTDSQLERLNATGNHTFTSEVHMALMSTPRWLFRQQMNQALDNMGGMLQGDKDSEEMMRDLFANTNPTLLIITMVVSVAELILNILAFKSDVNFWRSCDDDALGRTVSVQVVVGDIVLNTIITLYIYEENTNFLVLALTVLTLVTDFWKLSRAMRPGIHWVFGKVPVPTLVSRLKPQEQQGEDLDTKAMKWLTIILSPFLVAYGVRLLMTRCYKGWWSYIIEVSASCAYGIGFVFMTPQVVLNYKYKTVAYLPWEKFIYRAISTFIDDLFALIIKMPMMHRVACFRDDVIFFIFLYQLWCYPMDKSRRDDDSSPPAVHVDAPMKQMPAARPAVASTVVHRRDAARSATPRGAR